MTGAMMRLISTRSMRTRSSENARRPRRFGYKVTVSVSMKTWRKEHSSKQKNIGYGRMQYIDKFYHSPVLLNENHWRTRARSTLDIREHKP
jgi:hypothetical protein